MRSQSPPFLIFWGALMVLLSACATVSPSKAPDHSQIVFRADVIGTVSNQIAIIDSREKSELQTVKEHHADSIFIYGDSSFSPSLIDFLLASVGENPAIHARFSGSPIRLLNIRVWATLGRGPGGGLDPTSRYTALAAGPFGPLAWALVDAIKYESSRKSTRYVHVAMRFEHDKNLIEVASSASSSEANFSADHVALAIRSAFAKAAAQRR